MIAYIGLMLVPLAVVVPWWGTALFTLAGGVVGAVLAQIFNIYNSRRSAADRKLEAAQTLRREALVTFISAGYDALEVGAQGGGKGAFTSALLRFRLLVDDEVGKLADNYHNLVLTYMGAGDDPISVDLGNEYLEAEERLMRAAKDRPEQFGLPSH